MTEAALFLALAALLLSLVAIVMAVRGRRTHGEGTDGTALPADVAGLRHELGSLRSEVRESMRNLAVVRYDAFGDMGGRLSWSLALLDDRGDGVVLTSIHGRSEARSYAKNVSAWTSEQALSPEEEEAVRLAKG